MGKNLYEKLLKSNKPSGILRGFFNLNLNKKLSSNSILSALDLGAGVRK